MKITKDTPVAYRIAPSEEVVVIDLRSNNVRYPIVTRGPDGPKTHTAHGSFLTWRDDHDYDLVPFVEKPKPVCGWVNVYADGNFRGSFIDAEQASKYANGTVTLQVYMVEGTPPPEDEE